MENKTNIITPKFDSKIFESKKNKQFEIIQELLKDPILLNSLYNIYGKQSKRRLISNEKLSQAGITVFGGQANMIYLKIT